MKKWISCVGVLLLVFVTASCQKSEEVTVSKYFKAMQMKDRTTMAAMALDPVSLEFTSWKILSVEEPVIEPYALPEMNRKMDEIKKQKEEQLRLVQDKRYEHDTLNSEWQDARGKKKAELEAKVKEAKNLVDAETAKFNQLQLDSGKKKAEMETEKALVRLSNGLEQGFDGYDGKTITLKVHVSITTPTGQKDYVFVLRRYELTSANVQKPMINKWVLLKVAPKEELEK